MSVTMDALRKEFRSLKRAGEKVFAQLADEDFEREVAPGVNTIGFILESKA